MRIVLASLATAALLALGPAAALAQDAGSQQYQDPLAGDTNSNNSNGNGGGGGNTRPSNTGNAQAETDTGTQTAAASNDGLPRTGLDAWLLLLAGGTLLGGGFALRRVADGTRA
jgi:hypothetical protein